jgi:hypothetical protein
MLQTAQMTVKGGKRSFAAPVVKACCADGAALSCITHECPLYGFCQTAQANTPPRSTPNSGKGRTKREIGENHDPGRTNRYPAAAIRGTDQNQAVKRGWDNDLCSFIIAKTPVRRLVRCVAGGH